MKDVALAECNNAAILSQGLLRADPLDIKIHKSADKLEMTSTASFGRLQTAWAEMREIVTMTCFGEPEISSRKTVTLTGDGPRIAVTKAVKCKDVKTAFQILEVVLHTIPAGPTLASVIACKMNYADVAQKKMNFTREPIL